MSNTVIKVENLRKIYRLGEITTGTLSHDLHRWWAKTRGKEDPYAKVSEINDRTTKGESNYVWALKDINFEVEQGEVVGIIGRNGAGKSTLLKILAKVTAPSKGEIKIKGRIASLLDAGVGFHPELTGRENIFLNGAILGMTKSEIRRKFDEIVDFAGVERYIDTPVKRYSRGMYVRLAFAIAGYLEPEILIVDEVLAVGDAEFQRKCLGRMKDVSVNEGRTILFVSHNMAAVRQLCNKGIVMHQGKVVFNGSIMQAIANYQTSYETNSSFDHVGLIENAPGNLIIRILKFDVTPLHGEIISISSGVRFQLKFYNAKPGVNLDATFELNNMDDVTVFHHGALISVDNDSKKGVYTVTGILPGDFLNAGTYRFNLIFRENQRYELYKVDDLIQFEVLNENLGSDTNVLPGIIRPNIPYEVTFETLAFALN